MVSIFKCKVACLFKPVNLVSITFIVYFLPVIIILLQEKDFLMDLYPTHLKYPGLVFSLLALNYIILFFLARYNHVNISFDYRLNLPSFFVKSVLVFFVVLCALSLLILNSKLGIFSLLYQLVYDRALYFINQPMVGVVLASSGILKYFFISQFSFVLVYLIYKMAHKKNFVFYVFISCVLFSLLLFFYLVSRREVLIYFFILFFLGFLGGKKVYSAIKYILPLFVVLIITVNIRTGNENIFDVLGFLSSQEFYPFQFGAILIDKWISSFYIENPVYITPFSLLLSDYNTLSSRQMFEVFSHVGPGPTVSINYTLTAFFYFPVMMYFYITCLFMSSIYTRCFSSDRSYVYIPYYAFLCIKLILLIRNGEIVNHFLDCAIFTVLYIPLFVVLPRLKNE